MKMSRAFGVLLILLLAACSGFGSSESREADLVENGYTAMAGGDYATAEYLLNQALAINKKNPYTLLNLGVIYQETGRYEKARKFYQSVIDLNPKQKAAASNVQGYTGKSLADIARINLGNLPPSSATGSQGAGSDTDRDGVPDNLDKCSNTPARAEVGANGCWMLKDIFASGKADIGPDAYKQLDDVALILLKNSSMRLEIQGHTDDTGSAVSNQQLSEERARSVANYLIRKGVAADRLEWKGYGQTRPLESNKTAEGREQNRRVELNPIP